MGYFPTVNKGDKVTPSASFHNAVVKTVNAVRGDPQRGISPLSRTRTTLPVLATEDIDAWSPVELAGDSGFSWSARPYLVRQARTKEAAIGIIRGDVKKDAAGSATIFGLEIVNIPDNSTGDYVSMKALQSGKLVFTRTDTPTAYRILDSLEQTASKQVAHILWKPFAETVQKSTADFHAELVSWDENQETYTIRWLGGSALCFGENPVYFNPDSRNNISEDEAAYLFYDPNGTPAWEFRLYTEDGGPNAVFPQLVIPIWHFSYSDDGRGVLMQDFEGGVMVPLLRNALDAMSSS